MVKRRQIMLQIGIDQSYTSTGIVFHNGTKVIEHAVISTKKTESHLEKMIRAREISNTTHHLIREHVMLRLQQNMDDVKICIEGLSYGSSGKMAAANRDLAGLQFMMIDELLNSFDEEQIRIVAPTSLKKLATGKGNAKKELLYECLESHNKDFFDEISCIPKTRGRLDLVDAYWLSVFKD